MINWDAEIRKAKMFMLNASCMKYVDLAEQILKERNELKSQNQRMLPVCHYATNKFIKRQWNEIEVLAQEALKEVKE